jgi:hypothetical protein
MRQRIDLYGAMLMGIGVVTWGSNAPAQEETFFRQYLPAPSNAFELQLSTGYSQGFGNVLPNTTITDVAGAGIGFTGALGYRINPIASVELEGQYSVFTAEHDSSSRGLDTNIGVTLHAMPESRGDPWLRLATGWRGVWQNSPTGPLGIFVTDNTRLIHGWDVISARIGYDFRSSNNVAWSPVVGADLQSFIWGDSNSHSTTLSPWQWGTFIYAGLQGRFNAGGSSASNVASHSSAPSVAMAFDH